MNRYIYGSILLFTSLSAQIAEDDLSSIYTEAIVFVIVVAVMSIGSYIISSKHAKDHAIKNQVKIDEARLRERENVSRKKKRLQELLKMMDDGILTKDEVNVLKKWIYNDE